MLRRYIFFSSLISGCVVNVPLLSNVADGPQIKLTETPKTKPSLPAVKEVRVYNNDFIMEVGMKKDILANVLYQDDTIDQNLVFYSSNDMVLQIDSSGAATAISDGLATVTVQSLINPMKKALIRVTVKSEKSVPAVTFLNPESAVIYVGDSQRFSAKVKMSNGDITPNVIWKTDNRAVAVVKSGLVTGVGVGETMIHADPIIDSTKRASAKIKVIAR